MHELTWEGKVSGKRADLEAGLGRFEKPVHTYQISGPAR